MLSGPDLSNSLEGERVGVWECGLVGLRLYALPHHPTTQTTGTEQNLNSINTLGNMLSFMTFRFITVMMLYKGISAHTV